MALGRETPVGGLDALARRALWHLEDLPPRFRPRRRQKRVEGAEGLPDEIQPAIAELGMPRLDDVVIACTLAGKSRNRSTAKRTHWHSIWNQTATPRVAWAAGHQVGIAPLSGWQLTWRWVAPHCGVRCGIALSTAEKQGVDRTNKYYDDIAHRFGIDRDAIHSWHAGIHPGCASSRPARENYQRWSGAAFGNPRILHFHTCGDYAPGEICWNVIDPTIYLDGVAIW